MLYKLLICDVGSFKKAKWTFETISLLLLLLLFLFLLLLLLLPLVLLLLLLMLLLLLLLSSLKNSQKCIISVFNEVGLESEVEIRDLKGQNKKALNFKSRFLRKMGHPRPLFHLFSSF